MSTERYDRPTVERFLPLVLAPHLGCTEVRIIKGRRDLHNIVSADYHCIMAGWFDNPKKLADALHDLKGVSGYVTVNPVSRDLMARHDSRIAPVGKGEATSDAQIVCLRNLFVDFDAKHASRPVGTSATNAERADAIAARDAFLAAHPEVAGRAAWGTSGNGGWILVRLPDYPNDALHAHLCHEALLFIGRKFAVPGKVEVDPKTGNPSRVMCAVGTVKAKGSNRPDRPWRLSTVDSPTNPDGSPREREPLKLAEWLRYCDDGKVVYEPRPAPPANVPVAGTFSPTSIPLDPKIGVRIARIMGKIGPAVMGQHGSDKTYDMACVLVKGFGLGTGEALPYLQAYNVQYCQPPWAPHELLHKLESAAATTDDRPRGYLLAGDAEYEPKAWHPPFTPPTGDMTFYDESGVPLNGPAGAAIADGTAPGPAGTPAPIHGVQMADGADAHEDETQEAVGMGGALGTGTPAGAGGAAPFVPLRGERDPNTMPVDTPQEIARRIAVEWYWHPEIFRLKWWKDDFYEWDGRCYIPLAEGKFSKIVNNRIVAYFDQIYAAQLAAHEQAKEDDPDSDAAKRAPRKRDVTIALTNNVMAILAGLDGVFVDDAAHKSQPSWLGPSTWEPTHVLPCTDALVHLPSLADGHVVTVKPTPLYFSRYVLAYHFDVDSPEPVQWHGFLRSIWPDDPDSIACLQEWMGYLLTPDTSLQKMMQLIGPPRCGKGTIARVIRKLVGVENCVMPTISSLAERFGLSQFIGKQVAIFPDVRIGAKLDKQLVIEKLLSISGEDPQTFDRKHKSELTLDLPTRFMLISNNSISMSDNSGAYSSRFIFLKIAKGFLGSEDRGLSDRLATELPGILKWAVQGWGRLQANGGRFTEPRSADALRHEVESSVSPMKEFARRFLEEVPGHAEETNSVYPVYLNFMEEYGWHASRKQFLHDLNGVLGSPVAIKRVPLPDRFGNFDKDERGQKKRTQCYVGIRLLNQDERDAIQDEEDGPEQDHKFPFE